jgi:DNA-binding NarL/FixJ family response regulator
MDKKSRQLLEDIKKLLILQLVINGANSEDIANILKINSSTIRHMVSIRKTKKGKAKS